MSAGAACASESDWKDARFRRFVSDLAAEHRVVRYDRPGTGMSDRSGPAPSSREEEVAALGGLLDAIGLERNELLREVRFSAKRRGSPPSSPIPPRTG